MPSSQVDPPFLAQFLAAADAVAQARPEVDLDAAREVFGEAATLLYNGLIVAPDPGVAIRARSEATLEAPSDLHDPRAAADAYLLTANTFQL